MDFGQIGVSMHAVREKVLAVLADTELERQHWKSLLGAVNQAFTEVAKLRDRCHGDDLQTIHRLRIAFKRYRYMIELLQPLIPTVTSRELKHLRAAQNRLGEIQDADVLVAALEKFTCQRPKQDVILERFRRDVERRRGLLVGGFLAGAS